MKVIAARTIGTTRQNRRRREWFRRRIDARCAALVAATQAFRKQPNRETQRAYRDARRELIRLIKSEGRENGNLRITQERLAAHGIRDIIIVTRR